MAAAPRVGRGRPPKTRRKLSNPSCVGKGVVVEEDGEERMKRRIEAIMRKHVDGL